MGRPHRANLTEAELSTNPQLFVTGRGEEKKKKNRRRRKERDTKTV